MKIEISESNIFSHHSISYDVWDTYRPPDQLSIVSEKKNTQKSQDFPKVSDFVGFCRIFRKRRIITSRRALRASWIVLSVSGGFHVIRDAMSIGHQYCCNMFSTGEYPKVSETFRNFRKPSGTRFLNILTAGHQSDSITNEILHLRLP